MALQQVKSVKITGISACVPNNKIDNRELEILGSPEDRERFIATTGIRYRHIVTKESRVIASDLCYEAAEKLLDDAKWEKEDVDVLIFVSQSPDYILPATSCILQDRLGLSKECMAFDISLGCSGWVYGLSVMSSMLATGQLKKGLLLVGDTVTLTKSSRDKSNYPLFGDAGTATLMEYDESSEGLKFHTATDGKGYKSIIIRDGGFRHFFNEESLIMRETEPGIFRNNLQSYLNGQDVFIFGITQAPKSVKKLIETYAIKKEDIDYFIFHQANMLMNEKIRKKLGLDAEKVPYSISEFGNTSSASIPLTITSMLSQELRKGSRKNLIACGFGVGLSWGSVFFSVENLICPEVLKL